ncbi:MAG: hypothetical protein V1890_00330, partial [Candidatus Zixiibacteriota bacterium]
KKNVEGTTHLVTIPFNIDTLDDDLIKSIITQSGYSREIFYRATNKTANKIGKPPLTKEELRNLD